MCTAETRESAVQSIQDDSRPDSYRNPGEVKRKRLKKFTICGTGYTSEALGAGELFCGHTA